MLLEYIQAMRHAKYEILPDDGSYYGEILEFDGVAAELRARSRSVESSFEKFLRNGSCFTFTGIFDCR